MLLLIPVLHVLSTVYSVLGEIDRMSAMNSLFIFWVTILHIFTSLITFACFLHAMQRQVSHAFSSMLQLLGAGVGQYQSLYSNPVHSESGKWDALVKASESLLKEKELIIERQVVLIILLLMWGRFRKGRYRECLWDSLVIIHRKTTKNLFFKNWLSLFWWHTKLKIWQMRGFKWFLSVPYAQRPHFIVFFSQCCWLYCCCCCVAVAWTWLWCRQKQHMSQMEQRLRESELQVHGALLGRGASYGDMFMLRLQVSDNMLGLLTNNNENTVLRCHHPWQTNYPEELSLKLVCHAATPQEAQRENAFLRAQFAERTDCVALEKVEAERRLGAVESETRRLTDCLKETCERHTEEMKKQEERVSSWYASLTYKANQCHNRYDIVKF